MSRLAGWVARRPLGTATASWRAQGPIHRRIPPGDDKERLVCDDCGFIDYKNPKVIVGCIPVDPKTGNVLLCRRNIAPRIGAWTIPGGFLEANEAAEQGAMRETLEEANAQVTIKSLLAVYSVPAISQVHLWFHATIDSRIDQAGAETSEVRMFAPHEIPFDNISFPSIETALRYWVAHRDNLMMVGAPDVQTITKMVQ